MEIMFFCLSVVAGFIASSCLTRWANKIAKESSSYGNRVSTATRDLICFGIPVSAT